MPYVRDIPFEPESASETSLLAAISQLEHSEADAGRVYRCIAEAGLKGRTDDELEGLLHLRHQTASARRRGLVQKGLVLDSLERRTTSSGRLACVWIARRFAGQLTLF